MLALGISEITSGMGVVLAQFIGVVFQLLSIHAFFRKISLRRRLLLFLAIQSLSLIPLIWTGWVREPSAFVVIPIIGLYWASLLSLNPPWNKLMGHTVPLKFRIRFFSVRNKMNQAAILLGLVSSGLLLYYAKLSGSVLPTFMGIFAFGFVLKCLSWLEVKFFHQEYEVNATTECPIKFWDFMKRLKGTEQGRLISFLFFFYFSVHFASPFFTPYMLKHLNFTYFDFMFVIASSYSGRVMGLMLLQKRARSHHVNSLLIISTLGIATSPLLWALSQNYLWILAVEFFSGTFWAGFELSTILLYYQRVKDHERTSIMSYISFLNISGMTIGCCAGALMMYYLPKEIDQYLVLFAVATFLRLSVVVFVPHVDFRGKLPKLLSFNRVFSVRPPYGIITKPFIGKKREKK